MAADILRVLLVAGHGYANVRATTTYDEGATGCDFTEAALVRSVIDQVVTRDNWPKNVTVVEAPDCNAFCLTRNHPTTGHLFWNIQYLNEHYAHFDYILAIHANASDNPEAQGVEVYHANGARYQRKKQAERVARVLAETLGIPNRGFFSSSESQHSKLAILDDTKAPALLLEIGFITNQSDVDAIRSCGADALARAIEVLRGDK